MSLQGIGIVLPLLMMLVGALACFAGYKLMRTAVYIWGFLSGSVLVVSHYLNTQTASRTFGTVLLAAVGIILAGAAVAAVAWKWYSAGVFFLAATLTAFSCYLLMRMAALSGFIGLAAGLWSVFGHRTAIITVTAFSGAGLILQSTCWLLDVGGYRGLVFLLCTAVTIAGVLCQMNTTDEYGNGVSPGWDKGRDSREEDTLTFSERRYPGLQRAYRNYCINCGYDLGGDARECPNCGFRLGD